MRFRELVAILFLVIISTNSLFADYSESTNIQGVPLQQGSITYQTSILESLITKKPVKYLASGVLTEDYEFQSFVLAQGSTVYFHKGTVNGQPAVKEGTLASGFGQGKNPVPAQCTVYFSSSGYLEKAVFDSSFSYLGNYFPAQCEADFSAGYLNGVLLSESISLDIKYRDVPLPHNREDLLKPQTGSDIRIARLKFLRDNWIRFHSPSAVNSISRGTLAEDTDYRGLPLKGDRTVGFYPDGAPEQVFLSEAYEAFGLSFAPDTPLEFYLRGMVKSGTLHQSAVYDNIPLKELSAVRFYSGGSIQTAVLGEDTTLNGVNYQSGEQLSFYENGNVRSGMVAADTVINGITFAPNTSVEFYESGGILSGIPLTNSLVEGINISTQKVTFYENGRIQTAFLASPSSVESATYASGTVIQLYPDGAVEQGTLASDTLIHGVPFKAGTVIDFYANHKPKRGILAANHVFSTPDVSVTFLANTPIWFHNNGIIQQGTLARKLSIAGVFYEAKEPIVILPNGRIQVKRVIPLLIDQHFVRYSDASSQLVAVALAGDNSDIRFSFGYNYLQNNGDNNNPNGMLLGNALIGMAISGIAMAFSPYPLYDIPQLFISATMGYCISGIFSGTSSPGVGTFLSTFAIATYMISYSITDLTYAYSPLLLTTLPIAQGGGVHAELDYAFDRVAGSLTLSEQWRLKIKANALGSRSLHPFVALNILFDYNGVNRIVYHGTEYLPGVGFTIKEPGTAVSSQTNEYGETYYVTNIVTNTISYKNQGWPITPYFSFTFYALRPLLLEYRMGGIGFGGFTRSPLSHYVALGFEKRYVQIMTFAEVGGTELQVGDPVYTCYYSGNNYLTYACKHFEAGAKLSVTLFNDLLTIEGGIKYGEYTYDLYSAEVYREDDVLKARAASHLETIWQNGWTYTAGIRLSI